MNEQAKVRYRGTGEFEGHFCVVTTDDLNCHSGCKVTILFPNSIYKKLKPASERFIASRYTASQVSQQMFFHNSSGWEVVWPPKNDLVIETCSHCKGTGAVYLQYDKYENGLEPCDFCRGEGHFVINRRDGACLY